MQAWEQAVAEFEVKYANTTDEDAKMLALKSLMLETQFGEAGSFSTCADLRASTSGTVDDKVPLSTMKSGSPSTTNFVQNLTEKTQESEEEDKSADSATQQELFAMVQQFRKGKGKGKGVCWSCGESDITAEIAQVTSMMVGRTQPRG